MQYNLYAYCLDDPVNLSDPSGHDAAAALKLAVVMTTLAVLAMATGGVGLVVAVAALGAAGGMALGGTLAAENYYAANGTMTGAGDSVMNGMANGAMLGSIAGLLAGVGLSALAASGTGAGAQIAMNANQGAREVSNPVDIVGRGSTGRTIPNNLNEQMAMHQVQSNPLEGALDMSQLPSRPVIMSDLRWPASEGWTKMCRHVNGTEIHFVYNRVFGIFDDFKYK